jgi:hypothetical protein
MFSTPLVELYVAAPLVPMVVRLMADRAPPWVMYELGLVLLYGVYPSAPVT